MSFPWVGTIHKSGGVKVRGEDQLFSIKDNYNQYLVNFDAVAGTNAVEGALVPADEIWIVTHLSAQNDNTVCSQITYGYHDGAANRPLHGIVPVASNVIEGWSCHMVMKAGYKVHLSFEGCLLNDTIRMRVNGFKMTKES